MEEVVEEIEHGGVSTVFPEDIAPLSILKVVS
jgi:hypothetical protein